ncbi:hypothetical protein [Catenuloplanes atrovinosus]|uniref:Uncharacterized protein n=1 Tax=Catenuloplanes atrovinosus TaxID=137266 RepID=A0AAE3YW97_9ACTN|nr:hypothetical protein [Catenuloplanes atrovinosus]MDR7279887.1 hypothetical protein [Catenuloplanes atrovinosus]
MSLRAGLAPAYGDSTWADLDRLVEEIYDPITLPSEARRFYLNQIVAAEDAWITAPEWDACAVDDLIAPGETVAVGFDGSRSDDATALILCRISDGLLDLAAVWEGPDGPAGDGWEVQRELVDDVCGHVFGRYHVVAMFADVYGWKSYIDVWSERYRDALCRCSPPALGGRLGHARPHGRLQQPRHREHERCDRRQDPAPHRSSADTCSTPAAGQAAGRVVRQGTPRVPAESQRARRPGARPSRPRRRARRRLQQARTLWEECGHFRARDA